MKTLQTLMRLRQRLRNMAPLNKLRTIEDHDIMIAVGAAQAGGQPLTVSGVLALKLGTSATIHRRVEHLEKSGILVKTTASYDARVRLLALSKLAIRAVQKLEGLACKS